MVFLLVPAATAPISLGAGRHILAKWTILFEVQRLLFGNLGHVRGGVLRGSRLLLPTECGRSCGGALRTTENSG